MLVPRFSIRTLLMILTAGAVACLVAGMAYRGQYWAWGVTIALASLVVTAFVHAALFGVIWIFAQLTGASRQNQQPAPKP
jgi:hypothetical protein